MNKIQYSSTFKKKNVKFEPTLEEINDGFVDILTDNATITIKKTIEGYIIDVWDVEGENVGTLPIMNDWLEVEE